VWTSGDDDQPSLPLKLERVEESNPAVPLPVIGVDVPFPSRPSLRIQVELRTYKRLCDTFGVLEADGGLVLSSVLVLLARCFDGKLPFFGRDENGNMVAFFVRAPVTVCYYDLEVDPFVLVEPCHIHEQVWSD
jgi:hypothetical protein